LQQAKPIVVNDPAQVHTALPAGDVDCVSFFAETGWGYTLRTFGLTGRGNDTRLALYSGNGSRILENDDDPLAPPASRIEWTCPATGLYYASVEQTSGAAGCDVTYKLELTGGLATPTATPTPTRVPSATATPTTTPTPTSTRRRLYLPLIMR